MARTILTALLIVLVNVLVACNSNKVDKSSSKLMMVRTKTAAGNVEAIQVAGAHETDIVEQVLVTRQAYRQGLEALIEYYTKEGNSMKVEWAKRELAALDKMPQYNYIVEASLAGPDLRATDAVRAADYLYEEALALEKKARGLVLVVNAVQLRQALDKYNELITTYPSSDKIDDAAYQAAGIYEHFQDYTIASGTPHRLILRFIRLRISWTGDFTSEQRRWNSISRPSKRNRCGQVTGNLRRCESRSLPRATKAASSIDKSS
jgi:hypothetical protein